MSSGYADGPQYRSYRGSDRDYYEADRHSMRNFAGPDGYAVRDNYNALPPSDNLSTNPSALSRSRSQRSFRDGNYGGPGSEKVGGGGSRSVRSHRSSSKKSGQDLQRYDDSYDSDSSWEGSKKGRGRGGAAVSKLKRRLSQVFDDSNVKEEGNTVVKKWGATLAGAVVGGLAGRQAKSEHWVPTALGAVIGGLTAREAEKGYFKYKEEKAQEREVWEGRKRSRSTGY